MGFLEVDIKWQKELVCVWQQGFGRDKVVQYYFFFLQDIGFFLQRFGEGSVENVDIAFFLIFLFMLRRLVFYNYFFKILYFVKSYFFGVGFWVVCVWIYCDINEV